MLSKSFRSFRSYLTVQLMITVFVTVTVISVSLYMFLNSQLEAEFRAKALAEKSLAESLLRSRLDQVRNRLNELTRDNNVRISLMHKLNTQLQERLTTVYPSSNGTRFFVFRPDLNTFFPEVPPEPLAGTFKELKASDADEERAEASVSEGPIFLFANSIQDKSQHLATGYAVYSLRSDEILMGQLQHIGEGQLYYFAEGALVAVAGATEPVPIEPQSLPKESTNFQNYRIEDVRGLLGKSALPGAFYYFQPLQSLAQIRTKIYTVMGVLSLVFLVLSLAISTPIVRKLSAPLQRMADQAVAISQCVSSFGFRVGENAFVEFKQLAETFTTMLERLSEAEQKGRYKELFDSVSDTVCITDLDGNILETNEIAFPFGDCQPGGLIHMNCWEIFGLKDRDRVLGSLEKDGKATFRGFAKCQDGSSLPLEVKARKISYLGKQGILMVARDMSDWENAMRALKVSEYKYRALFQTVATPVVIVEKEGTISLANDEFFRVCGYDRKSVEGRLTVYSFFPEEQQRELSVDFAMLQEGMDSFRKHSEMTLVRADGEIRSLEVRIRKMKEEGRYLMVLMDLTERKWLEAQVVQSEKLAAVGELVSGVAHELNNPLTSVVGYSELIQKEVDSPRVMRYLDTLKNEANRAAAIVNNLLTFARKHKPEKRMIQVNEILDRTIQLRNYDFKVSNLRVIRNLDSDLPSTLADYYQLQQVFLNIINNAEFAMRSKEAEKVLEISTSLSGDGHFIVVRISDNGCGISSENITRIFDPFMTTREVGEGTGLGLSISYGIVQEHQGEIMVDSEVGTGTTFTIRLPVLSGEVEMEELPGDHEPQVSHQKKRILIIDDESNILDLLEELLNEDGYEVITSQNPIQGLKILENEHVDLIISDMRMPGMDGRAFLKRIEKEYPRLLDHFVFTTGDTMGGETSHFLENARKIPCLYKPFQMNDLRKLIQRLL